LKDFRLILIVLSLAGAFLLLVIYSLNRIRARRAVSSQGPRAEGSPEPPAGAATVQALAGEIPPLPIPEGGSSLGSGILRGGLVVLALVVAAGFVLILLPQQSVERMAQAVRLRGPATPVQEKIAFLYLGDEIKAGEFHLRGVVRNITTLPIERLDATIRLYSPTGQLLETRSVRMDSELIPPDGTAQFHLVYPGYAGQFGSYSVEFVSREGQLVPYKDMRGTRGRD
jgi:hypothetical protein